MLVDLRVKDIVSDFGISRQAFFKNNKMKLFERVGRGTYRIDDQTYLIMKGMYAIKNKTRGWKSIYRSGQWEHMNSPEGKIGEPVLIHLPEGEMNTSTETESQPTVQAVSSTENELICDVPTGSDPNEIPGA